MIQIIPQQREYNLLLKKILYSGYKLFTLDNAKEIIAQKNLGINDVHNALTYLVEDDWIEPVTQELYIIDESLTGGFRILEHEIALSLAPEGVISHYSAFNIHDLTFEIPAATYVSVPEGTKVPTSSPDKPFTFRGSDYRFIPVKKEHLFGVEQKEMGSKIRVTDLEKSLLDGLVHPEYCRGIMEVIYAHSLQTFDIDKLVAYALQYGPEIVKRLGWVLEKTDFKGEALSILEEVPIDDYVLLNPSSKKSGPRNERWHIIENHR